MWAAQHCSMLFSSTLNRPCVFTRVHGQNWTTWSMLSTTCCNVVLIIIVNSTIVVEPWKQHCSGVVQRTTLHQPDKFLRVYANPFWYRLVVTSYCKMSTDLLQLACFWLCTSGPWQLTVATNFRTKILCSKRRHSACSRVYVVKDARNVNCQE